MKEKHGPYLMLRVFDKATLKTVCEAYATQKKAPTPYHAPWFTIIHTTNKVYSEEMETGAWAITPVGYEIVYAAFIDGWHYFYVFSTGQECWILERSRQDPMG